MTWALVDASGTSALQFTTEGINALLASGSQVENIFKTVRERLGEEQPEEIYYYGAGCATEEICEKLSEALRSIWPAAEIHVSSDLLAAARSLFGKSSGIACILGTGSNSCLYNGREIETNVPSLGYVLGDEGSGAALGKRLVAEAFKRQLPEAVREKFLDKYHLTLADILNKVYRQPAPNKFLASLVPFLKENLWNPYVYSLVLEELTAFVKRNVSMYEGAHSLPVGFVGSIAYHFSDVLRDAVSSQGYQIDQITQDPMEGLIKYHAEE